MGGKQWLIQIIQGHYFIWQLGSPFIQTVSRNSRQHNACCIPICWNSGSASFSSIDEVRTKISGLGKCNNLRLTLVTVWYFLLKSCCLQSLYTGPSASFTTRTTSGTPFSWCCLAMPVVQLESPQYPPIFVTLTDFCLWKHKEVKKG